MKYSLDLAFAKRDARKQKKRNDAQVPSSVHQVTDACRRGGGESTACSLTTIFGDDELTSILSFVSYAPYEWSTKSAQSKRPLSHHGVDVPSCGGADPDCDHLMLYRDYVGPSDSSSTGRAKLSKRMQAAIRKRSKGKNNSSLQPHSFGTLTHVLPLVCTRFRDLCSTSDALWSQAIERLAVSDPNGWRLALTEYIGSDEPKTGRDLFGDLSGGRCTNLISEARNKLHANFDATTSLPGEESESIAKLLFKHLSTDAEPVVFSGMLFHTRNAAPPRIGVNYSLNIYEPRYRQLIGELLSARPEYSVGKVWDSSAHDCAPSSRPRFLYSYGVDGLPYSGDPVLVVELTKCNIHSDGRLYITIVPIFHARLSLVRDRMGSTGLIEAEARGIPPIKRRSVGKKDAGNVVSAPMIRMFSTVAPQLGMEFVMENIAEARYTSVLANILGDEPYLSCRSGQVIPHTRVYPRPRVIYTCQADRWQPLGFGLPGEDAFVLELRRCKVNQDLTFTVSAIPIQIGHIFDASDAPNVKVKVRVVLSPGGPKLV